MSARTIQAERSELAKRLRRENPVTFRGPTQTPQDRTMEVLQEIAARHGETVGSLRSKGRFRSQVEARRECYEYLRDQRWTTTQIGKFFHRDHSSVVLMLNADKRAERTNYMRKYYHLGRGQS